MPANQLLKALGQACGLPDLSFNDDHCARLLLDDRLPIQFEYDSNSDSIHIYSPLATIPGYGREQLFQDMLEENLFAHETAGSILALDKLYDEIVLWRTIPVRTTTPTELITVMEQFITVAEAWHERLRQRPTQETATNRGDSLSRMTTTPFMPNLSQHR